jgi:hypothetical protein
MISKCAHPAANPITIHDLRNVAQTITRFSNNLQAMRVEQRDNVEVPFFKDHTLCLREQLLQEVYAEIATTYVYALLDYLTKQGPFTAQFFTGHRFEPLLWEMSVTYDGTVFVVNVASNIYDADFRLREIEYKDCSLYLFETEGSNSVSDYLRRIKHAEFMKVIGLKIPFSLTECPEIECRVPAVTQYLGNQNPYTKEYSIPQVSLSDAVFSKEEFVDAMQYYLSWYCIKVVLSYQTVEGERHEEVVCNTGNISSQDTRYCLYWYANTVIQYMHEHERCALRIYIGTLRIYIGSIDKMEDMIAVDFSIGRDEYDEYEYTVTYLTSPKLSAMTKKEIEHHMRTNIGDYLHEECDMRERMIVSMREIIEKISPLTDADSSAPVTATDSA